ncbi:MAG: TraR/DksA C4-type zinc finger protein [Candidatus Falkowbacteria bacterium]
MSNEIKAGEGFDDATLNEIKAGLLKTKNQILKDLEDLSRKDPHEVDNYSTKFPEYGDKPDENAQEISEYSANIVTEKVLEDTLVDIEKALKSIDGGNYGVCKYCGNLINVKRLQARPTASSCVDCKSKLQENE